jgi:hypothetical protein
MKKRIGSFGVPQRTLYTNLAGFFEDYLNRAFIAEEAFGGGILQ